MDYIKHFNQDTANYLSFRPDYPTALYDYLAQLVEEHHCVWDCGTGNGQAALALANYFDQVIATDLNPKPLKAAPKSPKISYLCCSAEHTPLKDKSVDLITIAQALHWFNFDSFYKEVGRVAKEKALIAAWSYSLGKINFAVDEVILKLYQDILGDEYWPAARRYIDDEYRTIPFPFDKIASPTFSIEKEMSFSQLMGYLNTWSAVKEYELRTGQNPIDLVAKELELAWGEPKLQNKMVWPLHLLVGKA